MNIPKKPINVTFTDDQWKAIWATGQDMLVSAAAGSGKTKVLITRMIEKVLDAKNPIDVDELLVVTFTNAAAAEMRQRMGEALEVEITKNPEAVHLRKQLNLLNKAQISTLHSFCQNVVRQYAYLLGVDPGFRVADSSEAALLRDDALSTVLEYAYSIERPEAMYRLADSFTTDRDDQLIETLISRLYDYSRVHPRPEEWLGGVPAEYDLTGVKSVDDLSFIDPLKQAIEYSLEEAVALLSEMRRIAEAPDGPAPLKATAEADLQWVEEAVARIKTSSWEETYAFFDTLTWVRAGSIKKDSCDELLAKRAKAMRDDAKKIVAKIQEAYFSRKPERLLAEIALMEPSMHTLIELVHAFGKEYERLKIDRGIVDFSDLEHYALKILSNEENGQLKPSEIALHYQERFAEVLVDEFQDVNHLQETIIKLVKRGAEHEGNLFMVGDVKQSIYGFRLAEPNLFLKKYDHFTDEAGDTGLKIDLNANFRSRKEVLDATNFIFSQVMGTRIGGISYDDAAALKYGAQYPEKEMPAALTILYEETEDEQSQYEEEMTGQSLKSSQAEAHHMIREIKHLLASGAEVTDAFTDKRRPLEYRDIVILMRSMTWSGEIVEEFRQHGIPIYAELSKGYFEALEVMIMLNTLQVIDNPYQDIPLASVLRSPFIGLTENELAEIRLSDPTGSFYEAVKRFIATGGAGLNAQTQVKLQTFFKQFNEWRDLARRGSLSDLIWQVYTDTYYYEMVGAMANGKQRQANLRALHDRAIDYEKTSFRGLFRFLRFIDRMKKRGDDFGEAKALTAQENVVRLMTIHASKGLEFPYVFVSGIGRTFNQMDLKESYLFDQHFGLAVKAIDPDNRVTYTSLPFLAVKEKKELDMRAEEMRILYVAMTRAQEQIHLIASVKDIAKEMSKWQDAQLIGPTEMLPAYTRSRASRYIDWIGPAIARHVDYEKFEVLPEGRFMTSPSKWVINMFPFEALEKPITEAKLDILPDAAVAYTTKDYEKIQQRFDWDYPHFDATLKRSKQTVSEVKRLAILEQQEAEIDVMKEASDIRPAYLHSRPAFMQARKLSPAEIGTAMHTMMQQLPLKQEQTIADIDQLVNSLMTRQLLTIEEGAAVDRLAIARFMATPLFERLMNARKIYRELPFTYAYEGDGEAQILQGIADCLFQEDDGWVLLDYKTDHVSTQFSPEEISAEMTKRYGVQLNLYKTAIEAILGIQIKEMVLYLFDGDVLLPIQGESHS